MTFNEFRAKCQKLNNMIRIKPGPWWASAVYVYRPCDPDADPDSGLIHVSSIPSPRFYSSIPAYTQKTHPSSRREGEPDKVRGWIPALQMLITKKHINRADAIRVFGRTI